MDCGNDWLCVCVYELYGILGVKYVMCIYWLLICYVCVGIYGCFIFNGV